MTVLSAIRGDDETYELTIKDRNNVAIDLTGCSLWFTVKRDESETDAQAIAQKTIGAGITVVNAGTGRADVRLAAADTASLSGKRAKLVWDCQIKDATGVVSTVDSGVLLVEADVTRSSGV